MFVCVCLCVRACLGGWVGVVTMVVTRVISTIVILYIRMYRISMSVPVCACGEQCVLAGNSVCLRGTVCACGEQCVLAGNSVCLRGTVCACGEQIADQTAELPTHSFTCDLTHFNVILLSLPAYGIPLTQAISTLTILFMLLNAV